VTHHLTEGGSTLGNLIAYAVPVLPGQSDRVRDFGRELSAVRDRYDELNRSATVSRHVVFLQSSPAGDTAIHVMEANDLSRFLRDFDDSAYDRWWLGYMRDVHGVDLRNFDPPPPPEPVFDSSR
jgi:hypothetical protein